MNNTSNWLVHDHTKYDAILEECETAADIGEWKKAKELFQKFVFDFRLHMQMEDEILYPLFLEENGDPDGAIEQLSEEHHSLIRLVRDLSYIIRNNDFDHFLDSLEPLHITMKQHNENEEKVFLNMANQTILYRRNDVLEKLSSMIDKTTETDWDFHS